MTRREADRLASVPASLFTEMRRRIADAAARGIDVISLGVGDPDHPTPPHIVDALCRAAAHPAQHSDPAPSVVQVPGASEVAIELGSLSRDRYRAVLLDPWGRAVTARGLAGPAGPSGRSPSHFASILTVRGRT